MLIKFSESSTRGFFSSLPFRVSMFFSRKNGRRNVCQSLGVSFLCMLGICAGIIDNSTSANPVKTLSFTNESCPELTSTNFTTLGFLPVTRSKSNNCDYALGSYDYSERMTNFHMGHFDNNTLESITASYHRPGAPLNSGEFATTIENVTINHHPAIILETTKNNKPAYLTMYIAQNSNSHTLLELSYIMFVYSNPPSFPVHSLIQLARRVVP